MSDKSQELLNDVIKQGVSNCCSANVYGDICSDCKEHCEVVNEVESAEELDSTPSTGDEQ